MSSKEVTSMLAGEDSSGEAFGTYILLLLHLRVMDDYEASYEEDCLVAFARMKYARIETVKRILFDYGLFVIDEERKMFRSPYVDRVMEALEKRWKTYADNGKKGGRPKKVKKTPETPSITAEKPNETKERKREDKRTITTVEYNSSNSIQKESAAAAVFENQESLPQTPETEKPASKNQPLRTVAIGEGSRFPLEPVRPWEELVDEMGTCEDYLSMVGIHSQLGVLFVKHRQRILELFKDHIRLYDKGSGLLHLRDVKQYFTNCLSPGSPICQRIRITLEEEARKLAMNNPYRFESVVDGHRTYFGRPIPDDAPPRPCDDSSWDEDLRQWVR